MLRWTPSLHIPSVFSCSQSQRWDFCMIENIKSAHVNHKNRSTANDDGNTVEVKVNPFWCQTSKYACWKLKRSIWLFNLIVVCYSLETRSCSLVTPQHDLDDVTLPAICTWTSGLFTQWQLSSWGSVHICLSLSEQRVTLILHQSYIRLTQHHPIKPPTFQIWLHFEKLKIKSPTSVSAGHHLWRSKPDL